ncbi:MAG: sulfatase [Verrucomicrobiales bacterium]|nr:sulfatase [Verrucomicrobiales bacterium]
MKTLFPITLSLLLFHSIAIADDRPNILLIMPDQLRACSLGCYGDTQVITPNIDQLAKEGILFRHMIANTPVCCPARAVLLTGTYAHTNGMIANDLRLREELVTLPEILQAQGYRTGFVGKWHLDGGVREPGFVPPGPRRQGFEFWAAYQCHHRHFAPTYFRDTPEVIQKTVFEPEASCDFAVEFLESQPAGKPFFLTVQMGPPHDPYGAPEKYMDLYEVDKIQPRGNWVAGSETRKAPTRPLLSSKGPVPPFVPVGGKEELAASYAAITAIDDQVGRLVEVLKKTGLEDNTIVLFLSDHGDMLGSHGLRRKRKIYEESAAVPGIIRWPAKAPAGRVIETLFSHVDVAPTLLRLAGVPTPEEMQGTDLSAVVRGETEEGPEAVLLAQYVPFVPDQVTEPWRGIRTSRYSYARTEEGPMLLFDNESDPYQKKNLANLPEFADLGKNLDAILQKMMTDNGDSWRIGTRESVEDGAKLYKHKTFYTLDEYFAWAKANPEKVK